MGIFRQLRTNLEVVQVLNATLLSEVTGEEIIEGTESQPLSLSEIAAEK